MRELSQQRAVKDHAILKVLITRENRVEFSIRALAPEGAKTGCLVLGVYRTVKSAPALSRAAAAADKAARGRLASILAQGDLSAKAGSTLLLHGVPGLAAERVLLLGLGEQAEFAEGAFRDAVRGAAHALRELGARDAVLYLADLKVGRRPAAWNMRHAALVLREVFYRFDQLKTQKKAPAPALTDVTLATQAGPVTQAARSFVQGSVVQLIAVLLTFYFLFFLLRDRRNALRSIKSLVAIPGEAMNRLGRRISETIHATVYGTLVVAAVQGTMGGLMFWVLGLPAPVLWGIVMGMLAVVPVLGAFIIWIPAAIVLAVDGSWARAIVLTAWGSIVIGGIDNLLYPMLVGNRLQMHTVVAFIAMIGGLAVFGAAGLILGPVAVTVTTLLLEIWRNRPSEPGEPDSAAPTP
jgi:hypothetical protein